MIHNLLLLISLRIMNHFSIFGLYGSDKEHNWRSIHNISKYLKGVAPLISLITRVFILGSSRKMLENELELYFIFSSHSTGTPLPVILENRMAFPDGRKIATGISLRYGLFFVVCLLVSLSKVIYPPRTNTSYPPIL